MRSLGRQGGRGHGRGGQGRPVVGGGQGGQVDPQSVISTGNSRLSGGDPTDLVDEVIAPLLLPAVRGEGERERERGCECECGCGSGRAEEAGEAEEADGLLLRTMLSVQVMMDRRRRWRRRTTGGMRRWHSL